MHNDASGDDLDFGKVGEQLKDRGWSGNEIKDLVNDSDPSGTTVDNTNGKSGNKGEPASVYGGKDGYVVVNDKTRKVVQVSDKTDPDWIPDDRIEWIEEK